MSAAHRESLIVGMSGFDEARRLKTPDAKLYWRGLIICWNAHGSIDLDSRFPLVDDFYSEWSSISQCERWLISPVVEECVV